MFYLDNYLKFCIKIIKNIMNSIKINPYKAYLTRDTEVMSQMVIQLA